MGKYTIRRLFNKNVLKASTTLVKNNNESITDFNKTYDITGINTPDISKKGIVKGCIVLGISLLCLIISWCRLNHVFATQHTSRSLDFIKRAIDVVVSLGASTTGAIITLAEIYDYYKEKKAPSKKLTLKNK